MKGEKRTESAATMRVGLLGLKDDWENEFYTAFRYSPAVGLGYEEGVTRRDPSSVIRVDSTYYVWYTKTPKGPAPVGYARATDVLRATTWDLATIWYATSPDGKTWTEKGEAVGRGGKGAFDERSVFTSDILVAEGRYYLFYQTAPAPYKVRTKEAIGMAIADSPDGPWEKVPHPVLTTGGGGEWLGESDNRYLVKSRGAWDSHKVHDPMLIVRDGRYWLYYKGHQMGVPQGAKWGVAIAEKPEGPYVKSDLNPITNSGHEVVVWPYKEGVCALMTDGPEKNTIQYAPDGLNFSIKAHVVDPPRAAGPYRPDAFTNTKWGGGITWGLSHIVQRGWPHLVRFDCNLSSARTLKTIKEWIEGPQSA